MYKVIHFFTDLQDFDHPYHVGDIYPRDGLVVKKERIRELAGSNNKQGKPLINGDITDVVVEKEPQYQTEKASEYTRDDIQKMPWMKARAIASGYGIVWEGRKAKDVREDIIARMGL